MLIRAAFMLIATVALFAVAGGLAIGLGIFLAVIAPLVGYALLAVPFLLACVVGAGRYLDYRRDVFIAGLEHEERLMLIAAQQPPLLCVSYRVLGGRREYE